MKHEMTAVAFLGLIARGRFSHSVVGRCAAMLSVGFDTVPSNHENDSAGVFDAGKEFDLVRTSIVSLLENIAEDFNVFVALLRFDMLGEDLVDHVHLLSQIDGVWIQTKDIFQIGRASQAVQTIQYKISVALVSFQLFCL